MQFVIIVIASCDWKQLHIQKCKKNITVHAKLQRLQCHFVRNALHVWSVLQSYLGNSLMFVFLNWLGHSNVGPRSLINALRVSLLEANSKNYFPVGLTVSCFWIQTEKTLCLLLCSGLELQICTQRDVYNMEWESETASKVGAFYNANCFKTTSH